MSKPKHEAAREAARALRVQLEEGGFRNAKVGGFDIDGVLRGKYMALDKLESALEKGFGFCDVIFGWDIEDALYDNAKVTGWDTGYPDAHAVLDPATLRAIPWEPGVAAMLVDFRGEDGEDHPACPRSLLKRVVARAERLGFEPKMSAEFEFFFFNETRDTLREKNFRGMKPIDPGMFGYSWVRTGQDAELMADILQGMADFDIQIEALHTETGPGVYEVALKYDTALRAADQAALFKTAMKQIAHDHGLTATFMAKWNAELPGCSGHVHQSLWKDGRNVFSAKGKEPSKEMRHFLGGQMALMKDLTAVYSPTINSFKRYVPGLWAPLVPSWGVENRTCALRVIDIESSTAARIENRQPAADMNPYTAMAASLGAGLYGIEHELEPPAETKGDPGVEGDLLPTTLRDATRVLSASAAAREVLGEGFVDHYVRTRDWECRAYEKAVTDWELARYFEAV